MKKNITNISDDISFLKELSKAIEAMESKKDKEGLEGAEDTVLRYLKRIYGIAKGNEPLKGKQEDYISIQRVLSDDPELYMNQKVGELSYYFSYFFKLLA
jgi:hypothetical protein